MTEAKYYNWQKTLSFFNQKEKQARITAVIGGKGIGKTFGARKFAIDRFLKRGERFCELCRYANQMESIEKEYTEKLQFKGFFTEHVFKTQGDILYIAEKPKPYWVESKNGESVEKIDKPEWKVCGYFASLTQYVTLKQRTFVNVCTIIYDEFIMERESQYSRYLKNEYTIWRRCLSSIWREEKEDPRALRVIMLANAVDFLNPYFAAWNITEPPKTGYSWMKKKLILVDMVDMSTIDIGSDESIVKLLGGDENDDEMAYDNQFKNYDTEFLQDKTPESVFVLELRYRGMCLGIWKDSRLFYVNDKIAKDENRRIVNFHIEDASLESKSFTIASTFPNLMRICYFSHKLRFSTIRIRDAFFKFLKEIGIR